MNLRPLRLGLAFLAGAAVAEGAAILAVVLLGLALLLPDRIDWTLD